jgi:hypothetical protein
MNRVFDAYEYANSPACRLPGTPVVVERLILSDVFAEPAMLIILIVGWT